MGFKFAVDGILNIPYKGFFIVLFHINPDLKFYENGQERSTESTHINCHFNWANSNYSYVQYNESYIIFSEIDFYENKHIIIDIKEVTLPVLGEPKVKDIGWTFLPIFTKDGYINSNIYQLKVYKGKVTQNLVYELKENDIYDSVKYYNNKSNAMLKDTTVVCRLLDSQREV